MYTGGGDRLTGIALLNGSHDYVLHFPAGQLPPARYFWSLTMYDQAFFLVPNSINRYEIGRPHCRAVAKTPMAPSTSTSRARPAP